jgi:hypothetical protein
MTEINNALAHTLYKLANGALFTVIERTAEHVRFTAQGGGIVRMLSVSEFDDQFTQTELPPYAPGIATGDWLPDGTIFPCFYNGTHWNSWRMPQFERDVGLQLCEHMPDLRYDEHLDAFFIGDEDGECEFRAEQISVDGRTITVYPIGAGFWCWF